MKRAEYSCVRTRAFSSWVESGFSGVLIDTSEQLPRPAASTPSAASETPARARRTDHAARTGYCFTEAFILVAPPPTVPGVCAAKTRHEDKACHPTREVMAGATGSG